MAGSTAGLERQFSTLRNTYGSVRNRLGAEKAGKLGFLFRAFNAARREAADSSSFA